MLLFIPNIYYVRQDMEFVSINVLLDSITPILLFTNYKTGECDSNLFNQSLKPFDTQTNQMF